MSSRGTVWGPVIVGGLIVVLAGAGSYGWLAVTAPSPATAVRTAPPVQQSSAPTPAPTPMPVTSSPPTSSDAPVATVAPTPASGYDPANLQTLTGLVPGALASTCNTAGSAGSALLPTSDATAAIRCRQSGNTVVYQALPDVAAAQDTYAAILSAGGVGTGSGGCWDGSQGEVDYTYGDIACWVDPTTGASNVTWTFEPGAAVANAASSGRLDALVNWWWFHALLKPLASGAGLSPDEQFLFEMLPSDVQATCSHYDPLSDSSAYKPVGSLGSIDCYPKASHIADVGWFRFTTPAALAGWYDYRIGQAKVKPVSGGCFNGKSGETTWSHGRVLCFVSSSHDASIRWTDDRYQVYGALNASNKDLASLVAWWQSQNLP